MYGGSVLKVIIMIHLIFMLSTPYYSPLIGFEASKILKDRLHARNFLYV